MELEMLKTIIGKNLGRNVDTITERTTFVDELGVDSWISFRSLLIWRRHMIFRSTRRKPRRS